MRNYKLYMLLDMSFLLLHFLHHNRVGPVLNHSVLSFSGSPSYCYRAGPRSEPFDLCLFHQCSDLVACSAGGHTPFNPLQHQV